MVALNPGTGKLKWYFQFTPHDVHDWDAVEIPVLVDAPVNGQMRKLLVQANRNGFYYVLDRMTGQFLHGTPFVKMLNWASGLTPEGKPVRVPGIEPTLQGTKTCPATAGAVSNWMSPAYDPDTKLFYVVAQEGCGINTKSSDQFRPGGFPFMATGYIESPGGALANARSSSRSHDRQAGVGLSADRIEALWRGTMSDCRRTLVRG